MSSDVKQKAEDYYKRKKDKFEKFCSGWDEFTEEVPQKLKQLIKSGIRPNVSRGDSSNSSGSRQLAVNLSFEMNADPAKEYIVEVQKHLEEVMEEISCEIKDMDQTMEEYQREGLDSDTFGKLISLLKQWIDHIGEMKFTLHEREFCFSCDEKVLAIRKKWDDYGNIEVRRAEADKYGVSLENLDKHKIYLSAKQKKAAAKISMVMKQAIDEFSSIQGYLDADALKAEAEEQYSRLKAREDEAERMEQERIEAEKRARAEAEQLEAERKRAAEEEKAAKLAAEKESYQASVKAWKLQVEELENKQQIYVEEKLQEEKSTIIAAIEKQFSEKITSLKKAIDQYSEELKTAQDTLAQLGFFHFGAKKEQKALIEKLEASISSLEDEMTSMEKERERKIQEAASEASKKTDIFRQEANSKYPLPQEPVKPQLMLEAEKEETERKQREEEAEQRKQKYNNMTSIERQNIRYKNAIWEYLSNGKNSTLSEIMEIIPGINDLSNQRVRALLSQMDASGDLERKDINGIVHFTLNPNSKENPYAELSRFEEAPTVSYRPGMTAAEVANEGYKRAILNALSDGKEYTIPEMMDGISELMDLSNQRVAALVRQLVESGELTREVIGRKAYFYIAK